MAVAAVAAVAIAAFSGAPAGEALPAGWRALLVPRVPPAELSLVRDEGATVLRVHTRASAAAAAFALRADARTAPILAWRWKIERVVETADLRSREGDDFAARVYVFFDVPEQDLPLLARVRIHIARLLYGTELPTAALCYVWDNREAIGTAQWSVYTDRVRVIVLESGNARAGRWLAASRDVAADFRAAFNREPPAITGIAAGADTDQTGESSTAWFGDFHFRTRS